MTEHKSFKRLVRARMAKTGESYTASRANLLRAEAPEGTDEVALATSEEAIRKRTGRGWEEWFALLDEWGAPGRTHREIARWVAAKQGVHPLAWNAQTVAASYERARGLRAVHEKDDGFAISASKTVSVPVERLYDAVLEESRVNVTFLAKGESKSTLALEHRRLADAAEAERVKAYWRQRLTSLKELLDR